MSISEAEFNHLIGLKKEFSDTDQIVLGPPPMKWTRGIKSLESKDIFQLDFNRGRIDFAKYSYNKRFRNSIILIRLCSKVKHTNPDGTVFEGAHFHIYKEGFGDKIAFPISHIGLVDTSDLKLTLEKILDFCNVVNLPAIDPSLF